jgi:hypothetical protein
VTGTSDQWRACIGLGIGAVAVGAGLVPLVRWRPGSFNERVSAAAAGPAMLLAFLLVLPYSQAAVDDVRLFWAATALMGAATVAGGRALEVVASKKASQYADLVGQHAALALGAFFAAGGAGRFIGPLVAGYVMRISLPNGAVEYCPFGAVEGADGEAAACVVPPAAPASLPGACAIFSNEYFVDGCVLLNAMHFCVACAGAQLVAAAACVAILRRHWLYTD